MITLLTNTVLTDIATGTQTSTITEPTVAASSRNVFVTGNWFASRSTDRGSTFTLLDPFSEFPPASNTFCCDQLAWYSKKHRRWIWVLQYRADTTGSNVLRIAVSRTGASGSWTFWDLRPADVDPSWTGLWFDFPDIGETGEHLWLSTNVFKTNAWQHSTVLRIPWTDLKSSGELSRRVWSSDQVSAPRFAVGATDTMWFASLGNGANEVELFSWTDSSVTGSNWTVSVSGWNSGNYVSNGPGGAPWLSRADDRITGAWIHGDTVGFLWTAASRTGRPHPYIRAVRISTTTRTVIDEPDLWSPNGAWAYPSAAPNRNGGIGISAFFGGPTHPAHAVGKLDVTTVSWDMRTTATSTHGPNLGKWGDYLTCRPHPTKHNAWITVGYTLNGGNDREFVEPRYVVFS